jgi:hypothetical protein
MSWVSELSLPKYHFTIHGFAPPANPDEIPLFFRL